MLAKAITERVFSLKAPQKSGLAFFPFFTKAIGCHFVRTRWSKSAIAALQHRETKKYWQRVVSVYLERLLGLLAS